jgi:hypothetical protein
VSQRIKKRPDEKKPSPLTETLKTIFKELKTQITTKRHGFTPGKAAGN